MTHAMAQCRLNRTSLLPADVAVNTFHFNTPGSTLTLTEAANITTALSNFYTGVTGAGGRIDTYLSGEVTNMEVRVYDMGLPEPRVPLTTTPVALTTSSDSNTALPAEVALCLSFRGPLVSGTNPARRRGRVYLGPLSNTAVAGPEIAGDARPIAGFVSAITDAAKRLMDAAFPIPAWVVYSAVEALATPGGGGLTEVTTAWVDDAWDTQRRRGSIATTRTTVNAT